MTKPKLKPHPLARRVERLVLPKGWTVGTLAQWIPVISVAVGGIIWLTQLGDSNKQNASDIERLTAKEALDYAEMKTNDQAIWQFVGRSKEGGKP